MIKTILFILFFLVIALGIGLLCASGAGKTKSKKGVVDLTSSKEKGKTLKKVGAITLVAGLAFAIFVPSSFHQVEAGQVAVVKKLGKVSGIRYPGTYFDFYMTNSYTYFDTTVQHLDISTASYSSDAQTMQIQMTVQYKIDASKAENILIEYTNMESLSQRIEKAADDHTKSILSKYTAMKIIETRASISPEVETAIKAAVGDRYYASVTAVNLTNIDFTPEFEKAVEDKVVAEQQKEAAITKAEQELEVAKLNAQAKIEAARGDAESAKIIASAEAEAMALKIIELAKSIGFKVNETYIKSTTSSVVSTETNKTISTTTKEEEVLEKPENSVLVTENKEEKTMTTTTQELVSTKYTIVYDETHTKDDLKIVMDFVKYLEYLEKWDGVLPEVVSGNDALEIIVPSNGNK